MAIGIPGGDRQVVVPTTDPTFTSGLNYARSIAGGENVPNMIAPSMSYSSSIPQGFTQAQINSGEVPNPFAVEQPPLIRGISLPKPPIPLREDQLFIDDGPGSLGRENELRPDMPIFNPETLTSYKPFDFTGIQSILDSLKQDKINLPNFDDFVMKEDLQVPNGRDFSIENIREDLRLPDFENFVMRDSIPTYDDSEIRDLIAQNTTGINSVPAFDPSVLNLPDFGNFATKDDLPIFNPQDYRDDFLSIAREGIDIPRYEMPDVSQFITKDDLPTFQEPNLDDLYKRLDALENQPMIPNGSDFSISRPQLGLFG